MSPSSVLVTMADGLAITSDHISDSIALVKQAFPAEFGMANLSDDEITQKVIEFLQDPRLTQRELPTVEYLDGLSADLLGADILLDQSDCDSKITDAVAAVVVCLYTWATYFPTPASKAIINFAKEFIRAFGSYLRSLLPEMTLASGAANAGNDLARFVDAAKHIFNILMTINGRISLLTLLKVFLNSLSGIDLIIALVSLGAQILALIDTAGVALVTKLVICGAATVSMGVRCREAVETCTGQPPVFPPTPPLPDKIHDGQFGGNGGAPFVDPVPDHTSLRAVRVRYGEHVNLIQCIWDTSVPPAVGPTHGSETGEECFIELLPDEFIFVVTGKCDRYINQIAFHTNKRVTIGPFGGNDGADFIFEARHYASAPDRPGAQYQIAGFYGRSGDWLDQIGFILHKRI